MGLNAKDPLVQIGIASVVFTVPAILTTVYRLYIRRNRYWADDLFALLSILAQFVMFAGAFIHITHSSPRFAMVAAYYMMASAFYSVVWFARLSILFSIIRIHPDQGMRQKLYWVAGLFVLITTLLISQLYWVCEPVGSQWKNTEAPQCSLTRQVVVFQIVTDVLSDAILVFVPIRLIAGLSDKKLKHRLSVIFSTCLITTAVSLVHAAFILVHAGPQEVIAAITEDCVSLIVCNVPVVATRLIGKWEGRTSGGGTARGNVALSVRFATWISRSFSGGTKTGEILGSSWTSSETTNTGWFRWDRDLGEDSEDHGRSRQTELAIGQQDRERSLRNQSIGGPRTTRTVTVDLEIAKTGEPEPKYDDPDEGNPHSGSTTTYPPKKQMVIWAGNEDVEDSDRCDVESISQRR